MKLRGQGVSEASYPLDNNFEMIVSAVRIVHVKIKLTSSFSYILISRSALRIKTDFKPFQRVQKSSHSGLHMIHVRCSFYSHDLNITPVLNAIYKTKHSLMAS